MRKGMVIGFLLACVLFAQENGMPSETESAEALEVLVFTTSQVPEECKVSIVIDSSGVP